MTSPPVGRARFRFRTSFALSLVLAVAALALLLGLFRSSSSRIMGWQKTFTLSKRAKGCHLVTEEVMSHIQPGLRDVKAGMLFLFIQHTSAALTVNENFDPDVRRDMDMALDHVVPERLNWVHTDEGPDDSVSHTKTSLIGPTISVPITDGRLNLGTWQGIYLCEFRHMPHSRRIVATIIS